MAKKKSVKAYKKSFDNEISLSDKHVRAIVEFYLFECPVPEKSVRGKVFSDFGISGSPAFSKLKKDMLNSASESLKNNYRPTKKDGLQTELLHVASVTPPNEYCVFLKYDEKSVMQSLFSAIRNAFAHGSFRVDSYNGERIYFLQNYEKYLKAEMALHEKTLLRWIDCIKEF